MTAQSIREALGEHFVMWHPLAQNGAPLTWTSAGPPGEWRCACGLKFGFSDSAIDHVAEVIAALTTTCTTGGLCLMKHTVREDPTFEMPDHHGDAEVVQP